MGEAIRIGDPAIEIRLRRNARARRMVLRVSQAAGGAVLTLPPSVCVSRARAFALDQEGWLRRHMEAAPARHAVAVGTVLPYRGGTLTVATASRSRTAFHDGLLVVPEGGAVGPRVAAFLREAARQHLVAASTRHAFRLDRPFGRVSLRDPRGRWGSCTACGDLMFSWRLILAPEAVLDYVAAHEVAHLAEMNHSLRFWSVVEHLCPGYDAPRGWLRRHGAGLMAFDFAAEA